MKVLKTTLISLTSLTMLYASQLPYDIIMPDLTVLGVPNNIAQETLDHVDDYYHDFGIDFDMRYTASSNVFNAYARQPNIIELLGGMTRYHLMNKDAVSLVLLHEVGHHRMYPKKFRSWAANEIRSDFYAGRMIRKLLKPDESWLIIDMEEWEHIKKLCIDKRDSCERELNASYSLAISLAAASGQKRPSFSKEAPIQYWEKNSHPTSQCRLDTYKRGVLGDKFKKCH